MNRAAAVVVAASLAGCGAPADRAPAPESRRQDRLSGHERPDAERDCTAYLDIDVLAGHARRGDAEAQHMLARAYRLGRDIPQDHELAVLWFRRAAEQGHAGAQALLGRMHYWGEGLPRDEVAAAEWYRRAAEQGHAVAQFWLGEMHTTSTAPQDRVIALTWYRRAAEQGHAVAQFGLGNIYARGRGVPQDDVEAATWYALAVAELPFVRGSYEEVVARLDPAAAAEAQRRAQAFQPVVETDPGCVP